VEYPVGVYSVLPKGGKESEQNLMNRQNICFTEKRTTPPCFPVTGETLVQ